MAVEDDVRKASQKFYAALTLMANGNSNSLAEIWSHGPTVTTMHPIGGREVGWDAVKQSFGHVGELASEGKVELKDQLIRVIGDVAYEVGVEQGQFKLAGQKVAIEHRVTNIYQREGGAWKLVHHHTDISPAMLDVLSRLQAAESSAPSGGR
ncbi:MAG TPA: nuclear transport factor 2 family protein [bacterium]